MQNYAKSSVMYHMRILKNKYAQKNPLELHVLYLFKAILAVIVKIVSSKDIFKYLT